MIQHRTVTALLALALLAACGGGSSSSAGGVGTGTTTLTLQGTAATGAAISGATVQAKCSGGTGTATTATNGSYTINFSAGALPCVLEVATAAGTKLYSVATGTGSAAAANITPLTQLIVAKLTGKDPAAYFTALAAADLAALSATAVTAAQTAVVDTLKSSGVDASALGNLVSGILVAASGGTAGNAMDQILDTLNARLVTSGVTLPQLSALVAQATPAATPTATVSLPPELVLQPAAATCSALRSGTYRAVNPQIGPAGDHGAASVNKVVIDVVGGTVTLGDGTRATLTPVAGSPCRYTNSLGADITVSQAGVLAVETSAPISLALLFPEQAARLADLAGSWNFLGFDRANLTDPLMPTSRTITFDSNGNATVTSNCPDVRVCTTTGLPSAVLAVSTAGGFDVNPGSTTAGQSRGFAYRSGGGEMMLVFVSGDGTWAVATRSRSNTLPTAGTLNEGWNVTAVDLLSGGNYQQGGVPITLYSNTIRSVDATASTFVRDNVTNFSTAPVVTRPETIALNSVAGVARPGYNYRLPASVTNSLGATTAVPEFIQLPLRGMGVNAIGLPGATAAAGQFTLSVAKP